MNTTSHCVICVPVENYSITGEILKTILTYVICVGDASRIRAGENQFLRAQLAWTSLCSVSISQPSMTQLERSFSHLKRVDVLTVPLFLLFPSQWSSINLRDSIRLAEGRSVSGWENNGAPPGMSAHRVWDNDHKLVRESECTEDVEEKKPVRWRE